MENTFNSDLVNFYKNEYKALIDIGNFKSKEKSSKDFWWARDIKKTVFQKATQPTISNVYRKFYNFASSIINEPVEVSVKSESDQVELIFFKHIKIAAKKGESPKFYIRKSMWQFSSNQEIVWQQIEDQQAIANFMQNAPLMNFNVVDDHKKYGLDLMNLGWLIAAWMTFKPNLSILDIFTYKGSPDYLANDQDFLNYFFDNLIPANHPSDEDKIRIFFKVAELFQHLQVPTGAKKIADYHRHYSGYEDHFQAKAKYLLNFVMQNCEYVKLMPSATTMSQAYKDSLFVEQNRAQLQWWEQQDPKKLTFMLAQNFSRDDIAKDDVFNEKNLISSENNVGFFKNKHEMKTVFSLSMDNFLILMDADKKRFADLYKEHSFFNEDDEITCESYTSAKNSKKRWELSLSWLCHTKHLKKLDNQAWSFLHTRLRDFGEVFHREEYQSNVNYLLDLLYEEFINCQKKGRKNPSWFCGNLEGFIDVVQQESVTNGSLLLAQIDAKTSLKHLNDANKQHFSFNKLNEGSRLNYIRERDKALISGEDKRISEFYKNKLMTVLDQRKLKPFLVAKNPDLPEIVRDMIDSNRDRRYRENYKPKLDKDYYEVLVDCIRPEYDEFVQRMTDLLDNPIEHSTMADKDVIADFLIFNNLRVMLKEQQLAVRFYVRNNPRETGFTDLETEWTLCEFNVYKDFLLLINLKKIVAFKGKIITGFLILAVVYQQFDFYKLNYKQQHKSEAQLDFAVAKIQGYGSNSRKDAAINFNVMDFVEFMGCEDEITQRVASVLGMLYLEDDHNLNNCLSKLEPAVDAINASLYKYTHHEKYNEYQYLMDVVIHGKGGRWFSEDLLFNEFLDREIKTLEFWSKDSPSKALYLTHLEVLNWGGKSVPRLKHIPQDYFSYKNMIIDENTSCKAYKFESKVAMRRAFSLNEKVFAVFMSGECENRESVLNENKPRFLYMGDCWKVLMLWLQHTRYHANMNSKIVFVLKDNIYKMTQKLKMVDNEDFKKVYPLALELIYECVEQEFAKNGEDTILARSAVYQEIIDYISSCDYRMNKKGVYKLSKKCNILTLTKSTTIKSLLKKSAQWHRQHLLSKAEENKKESLIKKKKDYPHLNQVDVVIGKHRFSSINNLHELSVEGLEMMHCVESYHKRIAEKGYAVFKVLNTQDVGNIEGRATLGVRIEDDGIYVDQCFGKRNSKVNEDLMRDVLEFIDNVNKDKLTILKL